jgi:hypothetical protein
LIAYLKSIRDKASARGHRDGSKRNRALCNHRPLHHYASDAQHARVRAPRRAQHFTRYVEAGLPKAPTLPLENPRFSARLAGSSQTILHHWQGCTEGGAVSLVGDRRFAAMQHDASIKDNPPKPHTPGTKRRSGAGRKSKLTTEETSRGIIILRGLGRMSTDAAYQTLREAGINAPDSTLYRLIVRPAYGKKS